MNSSKKRTNEFVFTTMQCVFIRFWEEIEDAKKTFRNYLTFNVLENRLQIDTGGKLKTNVKRQNSIGNSSSRALLLEVQSSKKATFCVGWVLSRHVTTK